MSKSLESKMVFISSTVEDMQDERDAATEVLNFIRGKISRCEYFPARSNSPEEICLEESRKCNVFLGIYKNRYGHIPDDNNPDSLSVTELEYNEARRANRPVLLFYYGDSSGREQRLDEFLKKIKNFSKGHYVKKFDDIGELKYLVLQSLVTHFRILPEFNDQIETLDNLIPDLRNYQRILLNQVEYGDPKGIARPTVLLQYRIRDLFIPPELIKFEDQYEETKQRNFSYSERVTLPPFEASWEEIEGLVNREPSEEENLTTGINIIDKIHERRPMVILGNAGSGKSTLMKRLCSEIILNTSIIPFLINVKDLNNFIETHDGSILEYFQNKYSQIKLSEDFLYTQLKGGSCLIIFDGLDEVWDAKQRRRMNEIIEQFCSIWAGENKVIITSRFAGYLQNPLAGNFDILKIIPFSQQKTSDFIIKWSNLLEKERIPHANFETINENARNILHHIGEDKHLAKLASSPIILNIICLVFMKNISFPKRKHLLYSILVETLLTTWEESKGIEKNKFDWTEYVKLLRKISYWMFDNNRSQINQYDLFELIKNHFIEEGIPRSDISSITDLIANLEERSGLLISDGDGNYYFYHLSFLEYFASLEISSKNSIREICDYFKPNLFNGQNYEIISFVSAILSDKSRNLSSDFLNFILDTTTEYQEIHILNLLMVLHALNNGSTITDEFKSKVLREIDRKWDERRMYDTSFFNELQELISTPLEDGIVKLWRTKCRGNSKFYRCDLRESIIYKLKYVDDLIDLIETEFKNPDLNLYSSVILMYFVNQNPSKKLIRYLLENPKIFEFVFTDPTVFGISKFVEKEKDLVELYFKNVDETSDPNQKFVLLKYATVIDKDRARILLKTLPKTDSSEKINNILLGVTKFNPHIRLMNSLQRFLKSIQKESGDDIRLLDNAISSEYDEVFLNEVIETLAKIPPIKKQHGVFLCRLLDRYYEFHPESEEILQKMLSQVESRFKTWEVGLQNLILAMFPPTEKSKQILLENLKNINEEKKTRSSSLDLLKEYFSEDKELSELIPSLLPDPDFQTYSLHYLNEKPEELKKNIKAVAQAYYDGPLENYYVLPVDVVRTYISISQIS